MASTRKKWFCLYSTLNKLQGIWKPLCRYDEKYSLHFLYIKQFENKNKTQSFKCSICGGQGMHHSNPFSWTRLIPAGIRQFQLPAPSGMASPSPRLHLSLGSPYLMTNQGKDQSRTQPYWPNRELWGPLTAPELEGKGGVGSDFKQITIQAPLPNPAPTLSSPQHLFLGKQTCDSVQKWFIWNFQTIF